MIVLNNLKKVGRFKAYHINFFIFCVLFYFLGGRHVPPRSSLRQLYCCPRRLNDFWYVFFFRFYRKRALHHTPPWNSLTTSYTSDQETTQGQRNPGQDRGGGHRTEPQVGRRRQDVAVSCPGAGHIGKGTAAVQGSAYRRRGEQRSAGPHQNVTTAEAQLRTQTNDIGSVPWAENRTWSGAVPAQAAVPRQTAESPQSRSSSTATAAAATARRQGQPVQLAVAVHAEEVWWRGQRAGNDVRRAEQEGWGRRPVSCWVSVEHGQLQEAGRPPECRCCSRRRRRDTQFREPRRGGQRWRVQRTENQDQEKIVLRASSATGHIVVFIFFFCYQTCIYDRLVTCHSPRAAMSNGQSGLTACESSVHIFFFISIVCTIFSLQKLTTGVYNYY